MPEEEVVVEKEALEAQEARYLYCIINSSATSDFGDMGIEDSKVYTIPCKDIAAVVHKCAPKPYKSKDENLVKEWILAHQYIIDEAMKKFGTPIPFTFDTIIKGDDDKVKEWLAEDYPTLKAKLEKVKDKAEYTVQIFCEPNIILKEIEAQNEALKKLKEEIKTKPKGIAYMLSQKLERMQKEELIKLENNYVKDFYEQLKSLVDECRAEPTNKPVPEKWKAQKLILNLACLVHKDKVERLGEELGKINKTQKFKVRFTGPWAPFSFVGKELGGKKT
ncbi:MAG: GvpL/GvpF family gas vesicle protein [Candidatus Thermoplasmatota archaeon]|nr:GvpL/GvpF family gas vesicle protein [Candidatus Thermoplasmatota archaeon]